MSGAVAATSGNAITAAPPATRFFGVETEYGFAALGESGERLDPEEFVHALMHEVRAQIAHLHGTGELDVFTASGARVYLDVGLHPEVATPECSTPEEAVAFTRAGDCLLARAARALEREPGRRGLEAVLWKANVDHRTGSTWASHESYLHTAPQSRFAEQMVAHFVTRVVYTGAGGFDNRSRRLRFVVSPRAFHLEHVVSGGSTHDRGVIHTRDEPLAAAPWRRLHVLAGESLWSQTADYLRIGATALLVAQIDAGRRPQAGLDLESPLQALAAIAADTTCTARVALRSGGSLDAIAIQRRLLEGVEADLGADHLPPWAAAVCERWRSVLDRLEASPSSLVGVLDWPTKLAILRRQCEGEGLEWRFTGAAALAGPQAPAAAVARLQETDLRFNRLDDTGIFAALDRDGVLAHRVVSAGVVERAVREPPATGRARIRGAWVARLAARGASIGCGWDRIVDRRRRRVLDLGNPFRSAGERWEPLPPPGLGSRGRTDSAVEPIQRALVAGTPRQALRRMRALLASAEPPSLLACRCCASVIDTLVPTVPVPVLRRGGATAAPVLAALRERVSAHGDRDLEERVATLLYRVYEARGRYDRARRVIERMIEQARAGGGGDELAPLTNNLGYEYLLEGRWEQAEDLFRQSLAMFERHGARSDVMNTRANLLECRFGRRDPADWAPLVPALVEVHRALAARGDWRMRKTLRMLARHAEHRGRWRAARGWARRAVAASRGIPTQLRAWDRARLEALEARTAAARG